METAHVLITPPVDVDAVLGELQCKENDKRSNRDARVKGSGQDVVVSHPPPEMESSNKVVEDETNERP